MQQRIHHAHSTYVHIRDSRSTCVRKTSYLQPLQRGLPCLRHARHASTLTRGGSLASGLVNHLAHDLGERRKLWRLLREVRHCVLGRRKADTASNLGLSGLFLRFLNLTLLRVCAVARSRVALLESITAALDPG